jgi:cytochrome oxidase Cu insertion factor (SCO1/SenC/PrrC family)
MNDLPRKTGSGLWVGLALTAALVGVAAWKVSLQRRAGTVPPLPTYGRLADFTLTNLNGQAVSLAALRGKVWVADIIFTRCAGPCLRMTRQMKELEQSLANDPQARLVTLTTDPDFDTPIVLKTYAQRFAADTDRWLFLTGTKAQIEELAVKSLKLTAVEKKPEERESPQDLFIHSTIFVLVDKQGELRGIFETTGDNIEPHQIKSDLLVAINRLEHEP